eukprot:1161905-Pelagomonas_calceolata.AAC.1
MQVEAASLKIVCTLWVWVPMLQNSESRPKSTLHHVNAHVFAQEVLNLVVGPNAATASSASKRYRMRCLKPLILILSGGC